MMRLVATLICAVALALGAAATAVAADSGPDAYKTEADLLSQRVRDISAQTPAGKFPIGAGQDFKLRFVPGSDWNSGFLAGALWRVYDLTKTPADASNALSATTKHFGFERTKLHDLGFMYGESSVAGLQRCATLMPDDCEKLSRSGARAATTLFNMSKTTGQRIIPMSAKTCSDCRRGYTETIVDSMMNLPLLLSDAAQDETGSYRALVRRHADWVAKNLVRPDGSTYQAARYKRSAKRPKIVHHTHQGLRNDSVWARGQAWAIYGFADAGYAFRSKKYLRTAERAAGFAEAFLPSDGVPPWDYSAGPLAPRDVSAGVITAAGLFHLAYACAAVSSACQQPERWAPLARRILTASLAGVRTTAPIGYLGGQVYTMKGKTSWDDNAELMFGLDYALEAIVLARNVG